jgi:HEAT repeat protein
MSAGRLLILSLVVTLSSGCGHKAGPALSGGKPSGYWVKNATSPDRKFRLEAVAKLGNLGASNPEVLTVLTAALHDADAQVRGEAVLALVKLGPDAKQVKPDLEALSQRDPDAKVRGYAAKALEKLR